MIGEQKCRLLRSGGGNYSCPEGIVATGLLTVTTHEVAKKSDKSADSKKSNCHGSDPRKDRNVGSAIAFIREEDWSPTRSS